MRPRPRTRALLRSAAVGALAAAAALAGPGLRPAAAAGGTTTPEADIRRIHFPVEGPVGFSDDFGDPRSGGRSHAGNDLMGSKMQKLLSAVDGRVTSARLDLTNSASGNMLTITDADGWRYVYIHVNNDTPGTDDGLSPAGSVWAPGIETGSRVTAGQHVAYMGDSGNAEGTAPHLHFEIRRPDGSEVNPWASLRLSRGMPAGTRCAYNSNPKPQPSALSGRGYYVLGTDGGIFSFGDVPFRGSVPGLRLPVPVRTVRLAATPTGDGYWILGADGGIFSFGDAEYFGSVPGLGLAAKVTGIELKPTPSGNGYWILGADGGIFSFGDARFFGSLPGVGVRTAAQRLVPTPTGNGYWILGADGGIFSFGDARFFGSLPGVGAKTTPVAMAADPTGTGYWVLGADGGVFAFEDADFHGSVPGSGLCQPPKGQHLAPSATGRGYWVLADDGSMWAFGDARNLGSLNTLGLPVPPKAADLVAVAPAG